MTPGMTPNAPPPPFIVHDPRRDPQDDVAACAEAFRRAMWWTVADEPERWPLSTDEAEHLLTVAGEYALEPGELFALAARGIIPKPADEDGAMEWNAFDLMEASRALESRRQWKPDGFHAFKISAPERVLHDARRDGNVEEIVNALAGFDLRQALVSAVYSESREHRLAAVTMAFAILEAEHGVRV